MNNCFFSLSVLSVLLILSIIDIKKRIVPGVWVTFLFLISVIAGIFSGRGITECIFGMSAAFIPLMAVALISGGIGGGDIKLFSVLGYFCGTIVILEVETLAFIMGGIFIVLSGIFRIITAGKKDNFMRTEIPFVPFITLSFAVLLLDFFVK